jgi:F-type H+-transporting ATPase subunit epsilon
MADLPNMLTLEVATPLGMALSIETDSVQAPSMAGELGVLPGHVPLLAALRPGILTYKQSGQLLKAAVGGGFVEAGANHVRVITEFFQRPEQVDVEDARQDLAAAEAKLKETKATIEDIEYKEAERAQQWAQARLQLVSN